MGIIYFVGYCSPAGSTRHVAGTIVKELHRQNLDVQEFDLGRAANVSAVFDRITESPRKTCLFIGSPVYRDLAVHPIMQFIEALPSTEQCFAVPFVTWGGVSSGIALWQMANALLNKGFAIAGAAKIPAAHSLLWQSSDPLGGGRPNTTDDEAVKQFVEEICTAMNKGGHRGLTLETLDYQPVQKALEMKKKLVEPPPVSIKAVKEDSCTQCGICTEHCPTGALSLNPFPQFGPQCMDCFNCIRECPEQAIEPNVSLWKLEEMIRNRAVLMNEPVRTKTFLP